MSEGFPVFLFDIDGVLVEPLGYRRSIQATLAYFCERMGFGDLYPGEEAIARLEAIGMTSEWDITPILLADALDKVAAQRPGLRLPADLYAACEKIAGEHLDLPAIDTTRLAARLGPHYHPGRLYADLALAINLADNPLAPFPHLAGQPVLNTVLAHSRRGVTSPVTAVFQHYAAGSSAFESAFRCQPLFQCDSLLRRWDRPLLDRQTAAALLAAQGAGRLALAAFTLRPSAPPEPTVEAALAYSPEAELALEMNGLGSLPLVGYGQITWLAQKMGWPDAEACLKPARLHALAAIGAALSGGGEDALLAAGRLSTGADGTFFSQFPALSVHVFEDSAVNIQSVRRAGEFLREIGLDVIVTGWGICRDEHKRQAMRQAQVNVCDDTN